MPMHRTHRTALLALLAALLLVAGATGAALAGRGKGADHRLAVEDCLDKARKEKDDDDRDKDKAKDEARKRAEKACREAHKAHKEKHGNKWLVRNDAISVWFHTAKHGEKAKPHLKVFWTGEDGNKTGYEVKLISLFEVDASNESAPRTVNTFNLERSDDWNVQFTEAGDALTLRMTRAEAQGIVTLVWHLNSTSKEIKFDLLVSNWRWGDNATSHRLALDMKVESKGLRDVENGSAALDSGYVTWEDQAEATYADGSKANLTVAHSTYGEGDRHQHIVLVFNGPGGYTDLVYDPSFGAYSTQSTQTSQVPGPAFVGTALALAAAVAVLGVSRRRGD